MNNVISLDKYKDKLLQKNKHDMVRIADELIKEAHKRGICEHCGSFLDYPYHKEPCQVAGDNKLWMDSKWRN